MPPTAVRTIPPASSGSSHAPVKGSDSLTLFGPPALRLGAAGWYCAWLALPRLKDFEAAQAGLQAKLTIVKARVNANAVTRRDLGLRARTRLHAPRVARVGAGCAEALTRNRFMV